MTTALPERSVPINTIQITEKAASKVKQFAVDKGMDKVEAMVHMAHNQELH